MRSLRVALVTLKVIMMGGQRPTHPAVAPDGSQKCEQSTDVRAGIFS